MPSISALTPAQAAAWRRYYTLLDDLRGSAVWEADQVEQAERLAQLGKRVPPRFVVALPDDRNFECMQRAVAELSEITPTWPVQLYNETWGWARVTVNDAYSSKVLQPGDVYEAGEVSATDRPAAQLVARTLRGRGHRVDVGEQLVVHVGAQGLTVRHSAGRAWRLRAWSPAGEQLHGRMQIGAVVVRGVQQGVTAEQPPRKQRADRMQHVASWSDVSFHDLPLLG
jgi:hypothetical protein